MTIIITQNDNFINAGQFWVFYSSPSACQTSGASKNRDWAINVLIYLLLRRNCCYFGVSLVPWSFWGFLQFFDYSFWPFFLTNYLFDEFFWRIFGNFFWRFLWLIFWWILLHIFYEFFDVFFWKIFFWPIIF